MWQADAVMVVNRFRDDDPGFAEPLRAAYDVLAAQAGFVSGEIGRSIDDPSLWALVTHWRDVGSYRRALSAYDVKVGAVPLLGRAIDEQSAYEPADGSAPLNVAGARGE